MLEYRSQIAHYAITDSLGIFFNVSELNFDAKKCRLVRLFEPLGCHNIIIEGGARGN